MVAKWTTDDPEIKWIEFSQLETHPRFRDGVIRVTDFLRLGTLSAFLVMPRYAPLPSIPLMEPWQYISLRLKLFKVGKYPSGLLAATRDILQSVAFLLAKRVSHRDLKPTHIVVNVGQESSTLRILIIDYGNARRRAPEYRCSGFQ
ncbi:hypothetical protein FRB98_005747, partial [Tulasnella sp. 332]